MLVRVKKEEASLLRELEVATYQETFGPFIKEADMAHYLTMSCRLQLSKRNWQILSQRLILLSKTVKLQVFSSLTGDRLKRSTNCHRPLRFSEFMC